jgi:hypothetical protein
MLETLTHDDFRPRLGETFTAATEEGGSHAFVLVSVDMFAGPDDGGRTPFSLVFAEASQERIPQQTVTITHAEMGEFPLFVVPIAGDADGFRYEAVFT